MIEIRNQFFVQNYQVGSLLISDAPTMAWWHSCSALQLWSTFSCSCSTCFSRAHLTTTVILISIQYTISFFNNYNHKYIFLSVCETTCAQAHARMDMAQLVVLEHGATGRLVAHLVRADQAELHSRCHASGHALQDLHSGVFRVVLLHTHLDHGLLSAQKTRRVLLDSRGKKRLQGTNPTTWKIQSSIIDYETFTLMTCLLFCCCFQESFSVDHLVRRAMDALLCRVPLAALRRSPKHTHSFVGTRACFCQTLSCAQSDCARRPILTNLLYFSILN